MIIAAVTSRSSRFRLQIIRLPDWKLLIYIGIPFIGLVAMNIAVQVVDPLRPFTLIEQGNNETIRDELYDYCGEYSG